MPGRQSTSQPLEPESRLSAESESLIDIILAVQDPAIPDIQLLQQWADAALESDKKNLAIKIVSSDEMSALNLQFAGKNKVTNVLSFPAASIDDELLPSAITDEDATQIIESLDSDGLGDIAICADVVVHEAHEQHKTLDAHWAHMVVHGVLHLRGFDHIQNEEAVIMETREVQILGSLGFPDPYLSQRNSGDEVNTHS